MSVLQVCCLPGGSDCKESACNAGDVSSDPGSGRSPEEGIATHSNVLAWSNAWTEEPDGLQSMGLQRVGQDCVTNNRLSGLLARIALGLTPFQLASQSAAYLPSWSHLESKPRYSGSLHSHSWFCLEFTFYPIDSCKLEFFCFVVYICLG